MASNGISRPGDATVAGLADRTTGLVGWTIAWRATSAIATLALGAFLIRQLSPSDYGRYTFVLSVLVLPERSSHWQEAGEGLPTVLTPYLQILADRRVLFAGTHGLGAWYLTLP